MTLRVVPCTIKAACAVVGRLHRHSKPPVGGFFAVAVAQEDGVICGVAIVGRPVSRILQDGWTAEVTRVATDGTRNACSKLYAVCRRAAHTLGYRRIVTYTLASESGVSLRASGWLPVAGVRAQVWDRERRGRTDSRPAVKKIRWEASSAAGGR